MLLTPHILTGAAVAARVQNPILGIFFAFLSHYLLDIPPQKEYSIDNIRERKWNKAHSDFLKVFLDIALGMTIVYAAAGDNYFLFIGALAAIIPDSLTLIQILFPKNRLLQKHQYFHGKLNSISGKRKIPVFWGIFSQVAVAAIAVYFLL